MLRILLIEDDNERAIKIRAWLPEDIRLVYVGSAGRAIGVLKRDHRDTYAGIMLDHDLQAQVATAKDCELDGRDVVEWIIAKVSPETPVLVHSMNPGDAQTMVKTLGGSGFSVTRIPKSVMTEENFGVWLEEVRESWADRS